MDFLCPQHRRLSLFLSVVAVYAAASPSFAAKFSPPDNYLINCGSSLDAAVDGRKFSPDSNTPLFSAPHGAAPIRNHNPAPGIPAIYHAARIFRRPARYVFEIRQKGTHMLRLHFHPFNSSDLELVDARFHVLAGGYVLMNDFGVDDMVRSVVIKDYLVWVDSDKLVITFVPSKRSNFGFVNAIEVISAPKDLILENTQSLYDGNVANFDGLNREALEVVYRINVGGPKVTPFNDSLWRTWIPDDRYLRSDFGSKKVYFSGRIQYHAGGASREVGPDNVYNSARVISSTNDSVPKVNLTWEFPVIDGHKYLVRLHFCDIASISLGLIYFNVYVNGFLVFKDLDLSEAANWVLASPYYADLVVGGDQSGILSVSVGPSNYSYPHGIDGILNGVEIMKMNNTMGSLDGNRCIGFLMKSWPREGAGLLVPFVAAGCIMLSIAIVLRRRMEGVCHSTSWTKLPVDVTEVDATR